MRRVELVGAIESVINALTKSEIEEALTKILMMNQQAAKIDLSSDPAILTAFQKFSVFTQQFNEIESQLIRIMGLEELNSPKIWSQMIATDFKNNSSSSSALILKSAIRFAQNHLPKIAKLIEPELVHAIKEHSNKTRENDLLSVIILEESNRFSNPKRLTEVLESIVLLYEVSSIVLDLPSDDLSVIACDSGSDKSFDFLGLAKVIQCVRDIILSLWDRVVFYREQQLSQRIELVAKTLPIIDKIGKLEKENKIPPEQAEILRRKLFDGVGKFMKSGATIPEIKEKAFHDPRLLMAPEPKLLASGIIETPSQKQLSETSKPTKKKSNKKKRSKKNVEDVSDFSNSEQ